MKKIWILFLMFLVSISSYAFTLTCLGNYYSRISQMNVNIYQDLHNNRDGDFCIVTYENEGREYVRMVLGIKDLERLVKELDELKKNFPIYKKIVKDNGITDYHNKIGNAFPTKKKIQFFKDGTWHEDSSVNFALFINVTKDGFFYLTLESDDLDSTEKFGFFYTIGVGPNYTFSMSHSVAEIHNSASGATIAFFDESDFESLINALQKVSDKRKADMFIDEKFDKYLKNLDNIVRDLGSDK